MATVIDALVITLGLDPKGVQQGMSEAERNVSGGMSKITNILRSFAAPLAGAFAVGKLFNSWLTEADALGKFSKSIGQNIEDIGAWGEAVKRAGGTAEGFRSAFSALNTRVAMAGIGEGRGAKVFEALGIGLKDAQGKIRDTKDVLLDLADASQRMEKTQFVGLARRLGIDSGTIMALQQGRAELEKAIEQQKRLGVYTEADAKITADFNDRMADFTQALKAASASVFRLFIPALTGALRWINEFMVFLRQHEKAVQIFFVTLAGAVTAYALPALAKLALATATNPFTLLIAGAAALAVALEDLYVWANGGKAAFGDFWAKFGSPAEVKAGLDKLREMLKNIGKTCADLAKAAGDIWKQFRPLIEGIIVFAGTVKLLLMLEKGFLALKAAVTFLTTAQWGLNAAMSANPIGAIITAIAAAIAISFLLIKNWGKIKETALKVWNAVAENVSEAWAAIKDTAAAAVAEIIRVFSGLLSRISAVWNSIKGAAADAWSTVKEIFSGAGAWFAGIFGAAIEAIKRPFTAAFDFLRSGWGGVINAVSGVWEKITGTAAATWAKISDSAAAVWGKITRPFADATDFIRDGWNRLKSAFDFIPEFSLKDSASAVFDGISRAWARLTEGITDTAGRLGAFVSGVWQDIGGAASAAWDAVSGAAADAWRGITGAAQDAGASIAGYLSRVWDSIAETAAGAWQKISDIAADVWGAMQGIFGGAADWFAGIFAAVFNAITGPFVRAFNFISEKWQSLKSMLGGGVEVSASGTMAAQAAGTGAPARAAAAPGRGSRGSIPVAVALTGNAGQAVRPSTVSNSRSVNNSRHDTRVSVEKVEVVTQATDAKGIARDIGGGLQKDLSARYSANQSDAGVIQ